MYTYEKGKGWVYCDPNNVIQRCMGGQLWELQHRDPVNGEKWFQINITDKLWFRGAPNWAQCCQHVSQCDFVRHGNTIFPGPREGRTYITLVPVGEPCTPT